MVTEYSSSNEFSDVPVRGSVSTQRYVPGINFLPGGEELLRDDVNRLFGNRPHRLPLHINAAIYPRDSIADIPVLAGWVDSYPEEQHALRSAKSEYPVESGAVFSDHLITLPKQLQLTGFVSDLIYDLGNTKSYEHQDRGRLAWQEIERLMNERAIIDVTTVLGDYQNMVIMSANASVNVSTGRSLRFSISLEEVQVRDVEFVANQVVSTPAIATGTDIWDAFSNELHDAGVTRLPDNLRNNEEAITKYTDNVFTATTPFLWKGTRDELAVPGSELFDHIGGGQFQRNLLANAAPNEWFGEGSHTGEWLREYHNKNPDNWLSKRLGLPPNYIESFTGPAPVINADVPEGAGAQSVADFQEQYDLRRALTRLPDYVVYRLRMTNEYTQSPDFNLFEHNYRINISWLPFRGPASEPEPGRVLRTGTWSIALCQIDTNAHIFAGRKITTGTPLLRSPIESHGELFAVPRDLGESQDDYIGRYGWATSTVGGAADPLHDLVLITQDPATV